MNYSRHCIFFNNISIFYLSLITRFANVFCIGSSFWFSYCNVLTDLRRKIFEKDTSRVVKSFAKKQFVRSNRKKKSAIRGKETKKEVVLLYYLSPNQIKPNYILELGKPRFYALCKKYNNTTKIVVFYLKIHIAAAFLFFHFFPSFPLIACLVIFYSICFFRPNKIRHRHPLPNFHLK